MISFYFKKEIMYLKHIIFYILMEKKDVLKIIINTLIDELPNEVKNDKNLIEIDLVLDGGMFNGSYLIGAVFFLKEMEKRNFIKVKRISGCSIGSLIGLIYLIDRLDLVYELYDTFIKNFQQNYNFENYKKLKIYLYDKIPYDTYIKINKKLFIKYNNVNSCCVQKVKCNYKNNDEIFNTIIRSSFLPYLIDGNLVYENKYLDGLNAYFFKPKPNRKILFLDLYGLDKYSYLLSIKNEKSNLYRILSGILDIHIFYTKKTETFMCSYVDEWSCINKVRHYIRLFLEKIICCIFYFIKNINIIDTNSYKIINSLTYDILIIIIKKYCL